jgi:exodeoxyribonuclease V beta subunit
VDRQLLARCVLGGESIGLSSASGVETSDRYSGGARRRALEATGSARRPTSPSGPEDIASRRVNCHGSPPPLSARSGGPGTFLHGLLEWAGAEGFARLAAEPERLNDTLARRANLRGWRERIPALQAWLRGLLACELPVPNAPEGPVSRRCAWTGWRALTIRWSWSSGFLPTGSTPPAWTPS